MRSNGCMELFDGHCEQITQTLNLNNLVFTLFLLSDYSYVVYIGNKQNNCFQVPFCGKERGITPSLHSSCNLFRTIVHV
ncbi:unnamed protein product [Haemonchus placei]|uniref:Ovule protein n=1 Tax=Haemonchus placei TaxID=6290 RepID=A0A0N4VWM5_HAEPC|nr:unnamed protein product [Haemonchus placei]